jgi:hypothetical protein
MAGAHATALRLVSALEQLASEEEACLLAGEESALAEVLSRAEPLVQRLSAVAGDPAVSGLRPRMDAWLAGRQARWQALEASRIDLQEGLTRLSEVRSRIGQVVPAYGRGSRRGTAPSFHAAA